MSPRAEQPDGSRPPADLSLARRMLEALRDGADLRRRKVRRLRAAIRVSGYENALKLHVALERLRAELPGAAADEDEAGRGQHPQS